MLPLLVLIPAISGLLAFFWQEDRTRRRLLVFAAAAHSGLTIAAWWYFDPKNQPEVLYGLLMLDSMGMLFLSVVSALFLAAALYTAGYLGMESHKAHRDYLEGFFFVNEPERVFTGCMLLFLTSMTLVTAGQHFGLLWVTVEMTTLVSAPLIYFHRHHRSLEATWKYLLICSVGLALALLGNFLLSVSAAGTDTEVYTRLQLTGLINNASKLQVSWLKASFLFLLVGYGTKMGLAPMHTWLPDTHSESPSPVSALLSGALLNCAFLAILRAHQVCVAAGQAAFTQELLLPFGLMSMGVAAVFILGQPDYKRMLAYSSVENMGILSFGIGLGSQAAAFGTMLQVVVGSLIKGSLFLVAGNILTAYGTKTISDVRGVMRVLPLSSALWMAGFLAVTASPPFGPFLSEFTILKAAFDTGHNVSAVLFLALAALIFIGMAAAVLPMVQGTPSAQVLERARGERLWQVAPPLALCLVVLVLGLYIPPQMTHILNSIATGLVPAVVVADADPARKTGKEPDPVAPKNEESPKAELPRQDETQSTALDDSARVPLSESSTSRALAREDN
jgi:hydrogenase-4 component F